MKRLSTLFAVMVVLSLLGLSSCTDGAMAVRLGGVTLNITDTPLDDSTLTGVWITLKEIDFHTSDGGWEPYKGSIPDDAINLLELTGGQTVQLGTDVPTPAGHYTEIRFFLDSPVEGTRAPSNPGCYLTFRIDGDQPSDPPTYTEAPLFVPSGDTSGFKGVGAFTVPINGGVTVTADLDLRKSLLRTGNPAHPRYLLMPIIRLAVEGDAGWINGQVVAKDVPADAASVVAFAYTDGTWSASETGSNPGAADAGFKKAITSDFVNFTDVDPTESAYKLAFLAPGVYDLAIATFDTDGGFLGMWGFYSNAIVNEAKGTVADLSNLTLTATPE